MQNPLSPETLDQIRQTAAKISVANDVDPDIQDELRSHLEEKVLRYLSGEEKLSEADALLLARSHFGDPAAIKSLFQQTHCQACEVSLVRRLAAALLASVIVSYAVYAVLAPLAAYALLYLFRSHAASANPPIIVWILDLAFLPLLTAINLLLLWRVFASWRRRIAHGRRPWFQQCPLPILLLLVPLTWLATHWSLPLPAPAMPFHHPPAFFDWYPRIIRVTSTLSAALTILLWLRWCDRPPFTIRDVLATVTLWLVLHAAATSSSSIHQVYIDVLAGKQTLTFGQVWSLTQPMLMHIFLIASIVTILYLLTRRRLQQLWPA